ncbi:nuclear transport factor 2 family protein [Bradyrhizobium sp. LHD-71]|uniref:nuclear transport factor 2 family protein n=1 Tax=Bradyrhizobium sp. LHD-71 TaxID=3072141 RepID=UPI00280FC55D|nr:nuclear transport factor 2 family protein [Bradyrhizobium sp. LHD-71]MDQ8729636.1 nuclear transport factor 2 family protein [Bradyrhizobium sp. LHD-71]
MPSRETIEAFVITVESNDHVGAIERYYAPDASTRENLAPPTVGKDVLIAKERKVLASYKSVKTTRLSPILVDGDTSVLHWRFEFTPENGPVRVMEELALQTWRGEELVEERFFYDPRQLASSQAQA